MQNNPFAKLFYDKFQEEVLNKCIYYGEKETIPLGRLEARFIDRFNIFLNRCGQQEVDVSHHKISDQKLASFCSSLRFYMIRNAQNMPNLTSEFSHDKDLISLFDSSAQYLINRSRYYRLQGKRVPQLSDIYDYSVWKVTFQDERSHVKIIPSKIAPRPDGPTLFIFDPNRSPENERIVQKLFRHDMQDLFHGKKHEGLKTYFIHLPVSYPEEIAAANVLTTIRYPDQYTQADMTFAQQRWGNFLGKNLKYNEDDEIISGYRYEDPYFIENMKNLNIFGYCAAAMDAHRCLKAFKSLAEQIYEPDTVKKGLKNVKMMAYAMAPLEKDNDYTGIYFISNDVSNPNNPEHVMLTNYPELYQAIHVTQQDLKNAVSKVTETPSGDLIIASPMPPNSFQIDKEGCFVDKLTDKNKVPGRISLHTSLTEAPKIHARDKEWRDGHRLQNSTAANLGSTNHLMMKTVFTNMLGGKTAKALFDHTDTQMNEHVLSPALAYAHRHVLSQTPPNHHVALPSEKIKQKLHSRT